MLPPGPSESSLVQLFRWMLSPAGTIEELGARWGDVFTLQSPIFGTMVSFTHPDAVKQIFTGDPAVFHGGEAAKPFEFFAGPESVFLLDGAAHLHVRRLMLPAFHGERMLHYTALMRDTTRRAVATLQPGQRLALHPLFQEITLKVIVRAVLGLDEGPELDEACAQFVQLLRHIQSPLGMLWTRPALRKDLGPLTPWSGIKRAMEAMDRLLFAQIDAHRRGHGDPDDILSMLVKAVDDNGRGFDDRAIRDQIVTLLVAGHETSATSLSWAFEEILRAPGEQEQLLAEAEAVLGGEPLDAEHLPRLERIDSVVKEALRLHPVVPAIVRRLRSPAIVGGHELPAGVMATVVVHLLHRRPELYPEPQRFIGDRFVGKKVDPYAWAPFGGGVRRCLGMAFALHEMKVMLATMCGMGLRLELERKGPCETTLRGSLHAPKGATRVVVQGLGRAA